MMKRLILALALAMGVTVAGWSQRTFTPNFAVGVKGGATFSQMSFSPKISQAMLPGATFGVVARYAEEKHVGLIAELNFCQRGWKEAYEPGENFEYERRLNYLQLPLLTHIFFGPERFKMFINLGPEIGYMVSSSISANFDYRNVGSVPGYPGGYRHSEQLDMEVTGRFDYGIAGGLGCEVKATRRHSLLVEGRFYYGLGNIFPSSKRDCFSASRGMTIEVTAAWLFRVR